jgi:hypothetical protein
MRASYQPKEVPVVWSLVTTTWLLAASKLPAKSLHVGLALQYEAGLSQSPSVQLSNSSCRRFGVDRNAKYRGLRSLEVAGLITVKRKLGQSPIVTIKFGS